MEIQIIEDNSLKKGEVILKINPNDECLRSWLKIKVLDLLGCINVYDNEGNEYSMSVLNILYFETVDRRIFAYTKDNEYQVHFHSLNDIERQIKSKDFIRIQHALLINKQSIKYIKNSKNKKRLLVLTNNETVIVNRAYAKQFDLCIRDK